MHLRTLILATTVSLLVSLTGCSSKPETHPVKGIVQFPDGKLLQSGTIELESEDEDGKPVCARGDINPDGSFVLGTYELDDGALPGTHRAIVIADSSIGTGTERPDLVEQTALHPRYRSYEKSGLKFTIEPGSNELVVKVDYADQSASNNE